MCQKSMQTAHYIVLTLVDCDSCEKDFPFVLTFTRGGHLCIVWILLDNLSC